MVFVLVAVLGYTGYLGCGEQLHQFRRLQILGLPASSIDWLLFPLVYKVL